MLLKRATLDRIRTGEITLAFRRWRRPTVKTGGRLTTSIGVLAIEAVEVVTLKSITLQESRRAGFATKEELLSELRGHEGRVYRIQLRVAGQDPRVALRARSTLTESELRELRERLGRMDARSADGAWTRATLRAIEKSPGVRAGDLAAALDVPTDKLKRRVRRLKASGLTESLEVGYRLSPRGQSFLRSKRAD